MNKEGFPKFSLYDHRKIWQGLNASDAFIFAHELRREIIGKGSYLDRGATAGRVNGVQLDPIKLIIG